MRAAIVGTLLGIGCSTGAAAHGMGAPPASPEMSARRVFVDYLDETFRSSYAPLDYKKTQFGWDYGREIGQVRAASADAGISLDAFQRVVQTFFRSARDIHTSISFEDDRAVWLGLHIRGTDRGYRVAWIDRNVLPHAEFPVRVGDEVLALDGVDYARVVDASARETKRRSTPGFDQASAQWFAVLRTKQDWGSIPAAGTPVVLRVRSAGKEREVPLRWLDVAEAESNPLRRCPFWGRHAHGYVPELGHVRWRNERAKRVPAYIFESEGDLYGYVRLATYRLSGESAVEAMTEFDDAVDVFREQGVRGLVLDQSGNDGGHFAVGVALLSRVSDAPLRAPVQRYLYRPGGGTVGFRGHSALRDALAALTSIDSEAKAREAFRSHPFLSSQFRYLPATTRTAVDLRQFLGFVIDPPATGERLTRPQFQIVEAFRFDPRRGHRFEAPVVMLVDELTVSAAEYVAATMADSGGVTLFGATTPGAGGDQRTYDRRSVCGPLEDQLPPTSPCVPPSIASAMESLGVLRFFITTTVGYRSNEDGTLGSPIENVGVAPHVSYQISAADLEQGFAPMREAIVATLQQQVAAD